MRATSTAFTRLRAKFRWPSLPTASGCTPTVGTTQPSFITLGGLSGPVSNIFSLPYTVSSFTTSLTASVRIGAVTFGGQVLTIKQLSW